MKIVIDTGNGFWLSTLAMKMILDAKGIRGIRFVNSYNNKEIINVDDYAEFFDMYDENNELYFIDLARDDKDLISVIENLKEKSNSYYSHIKIVEIPDDVDWEIEESEDGSEYISEKHRIWY